MNDHFMSTENIQGLHKTEEKSKSSQKTTEIEVFIAFLNNEFHCQLECA